jgi:hypothetical protein
VLTSASTRRVAAAQPYAVRLVVIFKMKKCKNCNSPLEHIEDINTLKRPLSDEIGRSGIDGFGPLFLFIFIGLVVSIPVKIHGVGPAQPPNIQKK